MAHFAKIEDNIVTQILVVPNEQEHRGSEYLNELGLTGTWIQTSYNNNIRGKFAGIGDTYNPELDRFISPQPYPSWIANGLGGWNAPTPYPKDGKMYLWNEPTKAWVQQ